MRAWIHQDSKQVRKRGQEAASWYVSWLDPEGKRRCQSCGPGSTGARIARRLQRQIEAELHAGTYTDRGRRLHVVNIEAKSVTVPLPRWKRRRPVAGDVLDPEGSGFVYIIEALGVNRIKIGRAVNVKTRLAALQACCPLSLKLLVALRGGELLEQKLHERFASCRLHGEWFEATDEMRTFLDSLNNA